MGALKLLSGGATLAGDVEPSLVFDKQYKPCLSTLEQLHHNASKINEVVLKMAKSSGPEQTDLQLLEETLLELERGWAEGPFELDQLLENEAIISRRFPLVQGAKVRMIDDFSISGVNDSCTVHNQVDLHMIDTFCAVVKHHFRTCAAAGCNMQLMAKTYDLKSAYRQVSIWPCHYKYAYFSIYNCKTGKAEIYRLRTMPFGATHSVYCFLRLSRTLFSLAVRGLHLLATKFCDDFILASRPTLCSSPQASMELLFKLTGWVFAQEGKKATNFDVIGKGLGVQLDFNRSESGLLRVCNTEERRVELVKQLRSAVARGSLEKQETLMLRGRLVFADSFMHGRLGKLVLKRLIDHAYGCSKIIDDDLKCALVAMAQRLEDAKPREVTAFQVEQRFMYTDASYEGEVRTGGLGGVLIDQSGDVVQWFGLAVEQEVCDALGAQEKGMIIYELELLSAVLATALWSDGRHDKLFVHFGDNDGVRFSLIRASSNNHVGQSLVRFQLELESQLCLQTWYARVPTEANISDYPSRLQKHPLLREGCDCSVAALEKLKHILLVVKADG